MLIIFTPSHPQCVFVFVAIRRADRKPRICMLCTVAGDEHASRLSLVRWPSLCATSAALQRPDERLHAALVAAELRRGTQHQALC
ncbi:host cell division inhibitor Icd-like protein [Morganella morganii subsp. morganii]|nr:host cell division inhibitor Icd-like protein [Morganella morganii]MBT0352892.1 host cell division inhibitor Icd-like protein [Morganella morganii subsp. morganii]TPW54742.1 host cell division inhibitor Icd-like protein [Morganella morganii]